MTRTAAASRALALSVLLSACPGRDGDAPTPAASATDAVAPPSGSGDEAKPATVTPAGTDDASDGSADADVPRPPSLPSLMRRVGFLDASPADLDAFVHLPPGAEGQAGTFGRDTQTVRVALIGYPNDRYVRPHVTDVNERVRLLPQPREAIIANGRWVVHVAAADLASAQAVAEELRGVLGW